MKKLLSLILAFALLFSFSACGRKKPSSYDFNFGEPEETPVVTEPESEETNPSDEIISAYMDYIKSYVWVYYLDPSEIPEGDFGMYEWGSYYLYDFEKDGVPELILIAGMSMASSSCLVFTYREGAVAHIGMTSCAYGVGVAYVADAPTIVLCEFHGEYENFTAITLDMETLYVASSLPLLPEGSVLMEPTPIGSDFTGTVGGVIVPEKDNYEEPSGTLENGGGIDNPPPEELFLQCAKDAYSRYYDCSNMYVSDFWVDEEYEIAHCMVHLPIDHKYALETFIVEVIAHYDSYEETWGAPTARTGESFMSWKENILGTWKLIGEGLWGGEEHVVFELFSTDEGYAECSYGIGTVENTFGEVSYSEKYGEGSFEIDRPQIQFEIKNCCPLKQGRTKHHFTLHPDIGVYYRSGASTNVFPQEMTKAE